MANYPKDLAQDAVCQSHTGHMTWLWFLPARPLTLSTNEWMNEWMSLYYASPHPRNNDSNVKLQFLSLCRLPQLAMPSRLTLVLVSLLLATPAVIYWLWLVILPAKVTILCPEEWWCDPAGNYINCSRSSLTVWRLTTNILVVPHR